MPSSIHERTHHRSSSNEALHIERAHDKAKCPSPGDSHRCTSVRFLHLKTVCSSCGRSRNDFLRPPVRKPTLVWARITVWAVMPAQVVTPLETMESLDSETQLLAQNKLVMSFRLCRTAKLDLASAWKAQRSVSHSTTAPMSSTACVGHPKDREEAPSHRFFMGHKLAKVPTCPIECDQLRIAHSNHCLIGDM